MDATSAGNIKSSDTDRKFWSEGVRIELDEKYSGDYNSTSIYLSVKRVSNRKNWEPKHVIIPPNELTRWIYALNHPSKVPDNTLGPRMGDLPQFGSFTGEWPLYVALCLSGIIYGGLHLLAWNAPFPTDMEKFLWRLSSASVTSTGILVAVGFWRNIAERIWRTTYRHLSKGFQFTTRFPFSAANITLRVKTDNPWVGAALAVVSTGIFFFVSLLSFLPSLVLGIFLVATKLLIDFGFPVLLLVYAAARVYLIVECLLNLAHLSDTAYAVPNWSRYFPHIG